MEQETSAVLKGVGILGTGLVAGVIGAVLIQGSQGTSNAADTTQNGLQGGLSGTQNQNGVGPGQTQGGFGGGRGGGIAGETRLVGTISAVGSASITVKAADGTSTKVPVNGTTEIVRNGAIASLAALRSGDQVLVHVIPSGSGTVAERIFAGTSATGRFGGPPPGQPGQDGTGITSST